MRVRPLWLAGEEAPRSDQHAAVGLQNRLIVVPSASLGCGVGVVAPLPGSHRNGVQTCSSSEALPARMFLGRPIDARKPTLGFVHLISPR